MTKEEFMMELKKAAQSEEPVDILDMLRDNQEHLDPLQEELIYWDIQAQVFNGGFNGLIVKTFNFNEAKGLIPTEKEPDYVEYEYKGDMYAESLLKMAAIIMLSDCTGCCDALEAFQVSRDKILAFGDVSCTYHS